MTVRTTLLVGILMMSHPARSTTPLLPPPYLDVAMLQFMCGETPEHHTDPLWQVRAGQCRGYIQAIVDRYFETDFIPKQDQIVQRCEWSKTTDMLIAEVRESVNRPMVYGWDSRAEPWLREMLSKRCKD